MPVRPISRFHHIHQQALAYSYPRIVQSAWTHNPIPAAVFAIFDLKQAQDVMVFPIHTRAAHPEHIHAR
jgi:hypothetical protein